MPISPKCNKCQEELMEPGALLFGPPNAPPVVMNEIGIVVKIHLCVGCYIDIIRVIDEGA